MGKTCWDLIVEGNFLQACEQADKEYKEQQSFHILYNKILALLNLKKYDEVICISRRMIHEQEYSSDSDYSNLALANWSLNKFAESVSSLKSGLNTDYRDAAGGIEVPSFMYFIAIATKDVSLEAEAIKILKKKTKNKTSLNFPGVIAHFLLDKITEAELLDSYRLFPSLKERLLCKAYFHIGVKALKNDDTVGYYNNLEKCVLNKSYLEPEYYYAICELDKRV